MKAEINIHMQVNI